MMTINSIMDFILNNILAIGGILISPTLYRLAKIVSYHIWETRNLPKKVRLKHYHNGKFIKNIDIQIDPEDPLYQKIITKNKKGLL